MHLLHGLVHVAHARADLVRERRERHRRCLPLLPRQSQLVVERAAVAQFHEHADVALVEEGIDEPHEMLRLSVLGLATVIRSDAQLVQGLVARCFIGERSQLLERVLLLCPPVRHQEDAARRAFAKHLALVKICEADV